MNFRERQMLRLCKKYRNIDCKKSKLLRSLKDKDTLKDLKKCGIKYNLHYNIKKDCDKNV